MVLLVKTSPASTATAKSRQSLENAPLADLIQRHSYYYPCSSQAFQAKTAQGELALNVVHYITLGFFQ